MIWCKDYDFNKLACLKNQPLKKKYNHNEYIYYYNVPFTFDIEVSSFKIKDIKRSTMYIFMFSLNGDYIYGRTWDEFNFCICKLKEVLNLNHRRRIIIYIHNLGYEFQFLHSHLTVSEIFARTPRHPITFLADDCINFKCSYMLSGLSLEKTAENLTTIKIEKQVGKLDYNLIRHSKTPLTENELKYCEYDVKILHYFILEEIANNKNDITKIPLTKTSYVRRYCYEHIKKNTNYMSYRNKIIKCAPLEPDLFELLNKSFMGGYTHANCIHLFNTIENVHSIDLSSSYPTQYIRYKYPCSPFIKYIPNSREEFYRLIKSCPCIFEIHLTHIEAKTSHHTLSRSKCPLIENGLFDNGRIAKAERIITYMTNIDFESFEWFYNFDKMAISNMYISTYDFIPKPLIECILKFFNDKTQLKGIDGKESEYLRAKGMLNSIFGMSVTNPVNDNIIFEHGEWLAKRKDIAEALQENYVDNRKQFLLYQYGVFNTAYARRELFKSIREFNEDCVYTDTDGNKFLNYEKHKKWIDNYNNDVTNDLINNLKTLNLDTNLLTPKTSKGDIKKLGIWEYEGKYEKFKTLGAKRYLYKCGEYYQLTVSGLNKKKAMPYLKSFNDPFEKFDDNLYVPPECTGKLTMTYINDEYSAIINDYLGNEYNVHEISYIHSEPQEYVLGIPFELKSYVENSDYTEFTVQNKLFNKPLSMATSPYDWNGEI